MPTGVRLTEAQEAEICDLYQNGVSQASIASQLGRTRKTVRRVLKKQDVERRSHSECVRKYEIRNEHCFDPIDSERKAWLLGFLQCDGHISTSGGRNKICLVVKWADRYVVDCLRSEFDTDKPVAKFFYKAVGRKYPQACIDIRSEAAIASLGRLGVLGLKRSRDFPPAIEERYLRHCVRGWVDADGCVCLGGSRYSPSVSMSGGRDQVLAFTSMFPAG